VRKALTLALFAAACAGGKSAERTATPVPEGAVQVEDALHGVSYQLPPGAGGWQVANDGNARVSSGVQVEIATFPLSARQASAPGCRDAARKRLAAIRQRSDEDDLLAPTGAARDLPPQADGPRDHGGHERSDHGDRDVGDGEPLRAVGPEEERVGGDQQHRLR
jgi:hypothetical protein